MTKHEELAQLRLEIAALAATKELREANKDTLITLRDKEIALHYEAVDEAWEQKRPQKSRSIHYHERTS
jgi:hypothetical protein